MTAEHGPELDRLRRDIATLDLALLELLRRRMDLAARVGQLKARAGIPVVVRDVEERVLRRAREHAAACGVSPEVLGAIFREVMRGSVERQYRVGMELRARVGGSLLVVGGAGGMGSWFRAFARIVGHRVAVVDPLLADLPPAADTWPRLADVPELDAFDTIRLSPPLAIMPEVLAEVVARRPRGRVVEIASIKSHLEEQLAAADAAGVAVHSLHPMFGPGKSLSESLTFVLACRRPEAEERAAVESLLRHPFTCLVAVPFARHDRLMGWLLGLAHLTGILFGAALDRAGLPAAELHATASTTFRRQADTSRSVLEEDPELYLDIQHLNPHRDEVYAAMQEALAELAAVVTARDAVSFGAILRRAREALWDGGGD